MFLPYSVAKLLTVSIVAACIPTVGAFNDSTYERAVSLMESSPLIDTHMDLPQILRSLCKTFAPFTCLCKAATEWIGQLEIPSR